MPVRRVRQTGVNIVGAIPSRKLGRMVRYESLLERAIFHLLEHDPTVLWYEEQPCTIRYHYTGRAHTYTPDVRIEWCDGSRTIVECKPSKRVDELAEAVKWTAARAWCERYGARFTLITEQTLRPYATLLDNLRLLRPHAYWPLALHQREHFLRRLAALGGEATIAALLELDDPLAAAGLLAGKAAIWHLLYDGTLQADLTRALDLWTTRVSLTTEEEAVS